MGIGDIIVIGLLLVWLAAALRVMAKAKRGGRRAGCGCSCEECSRSLCDRSLSGCNCDTYVGKKD